MHTHPKSLSFILSSGLLALFVSSVGAQVGPNPSEIPQIAPLEIIVAQNPSDQPSTSQSLRPAIDEILLAKARSENGQSTTPASEAIAIARDIHPTSESLPIGRPSGQSVLIGTPESSTGATSTQGWTQSIVALLGVILLILGLGQLYKRLARVQGGLAGQVGAGGTAPSGIIEVIGRYPLSKGMTLIVLKFDRKVLLLSHASSSKGKWGKSASMQTLCELADPEDVASILLKARSASGDSIAQSFEQTLREADELTDEHLNDVDLGYAEVNPVRFPSHRREPVRTITTDEGDRAELWSSGQDSRAAAGVLRRRLVSMRREQQG